MITFCRTISPWRTEFLTSRTSYKFLPKLKEAKENKCFLKPCFFFPTANRENTFKNCGKTTDILAFHSICLF